MFGLGFVAGRLVVCVIYANVANAPAVAGGEVALGKFFSLVPGDPWTAEDFFSQGKETSENKWTEGVAIG